MSERANNQEWCEESFFGAILALLIHYRPTTAGSTSAVVQGGNSKVKMKSKYDAKNGSWKQQGNPAREKQCCAKRPGHAAIKSGNGRNKKAHTDNSTLKPLRTKTIKVHGKTSCSLEIQKQNHAGERRFWRQARKRTWLIRNWARAAQTDVR